MNFMKLIRAIAMVGLFLSGGSAWAGIPEGACGTTFFDFLIKNTSQKVGTVTVANDATNLYVEFELTAANYKFDNYLNVWAGSDLSNKPESPFQFPNPVTNAKGTEYTYVLPLSGLGITDTSRSCPVINVVAFARITDSSEDGAVSAFGQGRYQLCCDEPPQLGACETAFAKGGYVFTTSSKSNPEGLPSLKLSRNRWGWAINLTETGTTTYDIWKGAGLNDTSKGELVGTLTVIWDGSIVTVSYDMSYDVMNELHIYANDSKPKKVAPGKFGYTKSFDPAVSTHTASFAVTDKKGDGIWLIAHAVSCANQD